MLNLVQHLIRFEIPKQVRNDNKCSKLENPDWLTSFKALTHNNSMKSLADKVINGELLSGDEALSLVQAEGAELFELFSQANRIREAKRPPVVDLCSIVSAKTGACPEDCTYCAQSKTSMAEISKHRLVGRKYVVERARAAKEWGARRFCIVTSGKAPTAHELEKIALMISAVREAGLLPCATLGLLDEDALRMLKEAGLHRYHHNLVTSRRFFPEVCRSHSYDDKLRTIEAVVNVNEVVE